MRFARKSWIREAIGRSSRGRRVAGLVAAAGFGLAMAGAGSAQVGLSDGELEIGGSDEPVLLGFNDDWMQRSELIDFAAGAGADVLRFPIAWQLVEPRPGEWDWSELDELYELARERGIRLILSVQDSPCWARPSLGCPGPPGSRPPDRAYLLHYARTLRLAVQRYPDAVAVEVWNEPNLSHYFRPRPSPARYADLLRVSHAAVKGVRPRLPILFGGLATVRDPSVAGRMGHVEFLRAVHRAGGTPFYDAMSVHSYRGTRGTLAALREIRGELERVGRGDRELWVTEVGYSVRESGNEARQALRLIRTLRALEKVPKLRGIIVHRMFDIRGTGRYADMGLVRTGGRVKIAYCAFAHLRQTSCEPPRWPPEEEPKTE